MAVEAVIQVVVAEAVVVLPVAATDAVSLAISQGSALTGLRSVI